MRLGLSFNSFYNFNYTKIRQVFMKERFHYNLFYSITNNLQMHTSNELHSHLISVQKFLTALSKVSKMSGKVGEN